MVDGYFAQGTSTTQVFDVPNDFGLYDYFITYVQARPFVKITKQQNECFAEECKERHLNLVGTTLSPEESARFCVGAIIEAQLTIVTSSEGETLVSEPYRLRVEKGLYTLGGGIK